jgi:two-component system, NtrC family, sensor kinase
MMENTKYYRSLTRNMVLIMIVVSFAPFLLIGGLIGHYFHTSYREKVVAHLVELVQKHQQNINGFLHEKLAYIKVLGNSYTFDQLSDEAFLEQKLAILQGAYGGVFVDLGVVNDRGLQISYAGAFKLERANYSEAEWFKEAITRPTYVSNVFMGLRRQPHFIVAVKQKWGGQEWILRATIDFEEFNSLVENVRIGKTGRAFIINRKGDFQTRPHLESEQRKDFFVKFLTDSTLNIPAGASPDDHPALRETAQPIVGINDHEILAGEGKDAGKDFLYVMMPLKAGEWILTYQQEEEDAFSDLYRARRLAILIALLGGLAIVVMSFALFKRMVKRIEKADMEKEMMNEQVIEAGKLASVGELAAGIAHEINNPVAIMVEEAGWMGDLLDEEDLRESPNIEEFKRALAQIRTQGERCKEITHKLLSFARRTDPRTQQMQMNELIEELIDISEQRSRFGNVKLVKHLAPDLPEICASPSEIQQVLLNLINNAIDAIGPAGGSVEITSRVDGSKMVVDVADTGHGIPKSVMARIFDPFFTTKPVGKGTGLGLSICYGIVKKMGGDITVNSAAGIGTVFHVHLPLPPDGRKE